MNKLITYTHTMDLQGKEQWTKYLCMMIILQIYVEFI